MNEQDFLDIYRRELGLPIKPRKRHFLERNTIPQMDYEERIKKEALTGEKIGYSDGYGDKFSETSTELPTKTPLGIGETKSNFDWSGVGDVGVAGLETVTGMIASNELGKAENYDSVVALKEGQKAKTMDWASKGAALGGTIGSVVPVIGTAVGTIAGGVIGALAGTSGQKKERKKALVAVDEKGNKKFTDASKRLSQEYFYKTGSNRNKALQELSTRQSTIFNT